jgi:carboxymethylenebutenolidase
MAERSVCQAGALGRRSFFTLASETALLALLAAVTRPVLVEAVQIAPEDPRLKTGRVTVPNYAGGLQCYRARPASESGALGSVLVMHDILGLTPHYEDVARRFAIEGFAALAPDYASRYGGTPPDPDPAREIVGMATWPQMIADTNAALAWLRSQDHANGKVAAVGFGLGGSALGRAVMRLPEISAAVLLYGRVPPADHVIEIKTPLLLIYAGEDPVVNSDVPGFLDALGAAGQHPDVETYSGARHGFDDDTQGARYSPEAATLAWKRIVTFIRPLVG